MRIMGLDVGERRIGVAISDGLGITAQGKDTVARDRWEDSLRQMIDEYEVSAIVVGLPKMMNGSVGVQGGKVQDFTEELKKAFDLPVEFWDERLSTVSAERTLLLADTSRKKRKAVRDKLAAVLILQNYLDSRKP